MRNSHASTHSHVTSIVTSSVHKPLFHNYVAIPTISQPVLRSPPFHNYVAIPSISQRDTPPQFTPKTKLRNVTLSGRRKNERKGRSDTKQCVLGVGTLIGVAMACMAVANIVKSSLGPVGLDKMLVGFAMPPLSA